MVTRLPEPPRELRSLCLGSSKPSAGDLNAEGELGTWFLKKSTQQKKAEQSCDPAHVQGGGSCIAAGSAKQQVRASYSSTNVLLLANHPAGGGVCHPGKKAGEPISPKTASCNFAEGVWQAGHFSSSSSALPTAKVTQPGEAQADTAPSVPSAGTWGLAAVGAVCQTAHGRAAQRPCRNRLCLLGIRKCNRF